MLPLNCLRCADSKSNSSTRLPRRTTTRVSSGWVASISILLAIGKSHRDRLGRLRRAVPARDVSAPDGGTGPIFGGWGGLETASAASKRDPADGERRMSTAEPGQLDLDLRLEHKLQTTMGRQRCTRP